MKRGQSPEPLRGETVTVTGIAAAGLIGWSGPSAAPLGGCAALIEQVAPAVVVIEVTAVAREARSGRGPLLRTGNPLEEFLDRFGIPLPEQLDPEQPGTKQRALQRRGFGLGFLIDAAGKIVTNYHVVANSAAVQVRLSDGRSFEAEVAGVDCTTDLALLRISAGHDLPFVGFGDCGTVSRGDHLIAVGNHFGLPSLTTTRVGSKLARDIDVGPHDDFVRIEAAINHGISGGPLFNEKGEVIGVNTAIFSPRDGFFAIGFSVPANIARHVIVQLDATGTVNRGCLGVELQRLSPELADALLLPDQEGVLVSAVHPAGPAAAAGLEAGDVVRTFGGAAIGRLRDLPWLVAAARPGDEVEVGLYRDGRPLDLLVQVAALDAHSTATEPPTAEPASEVVSRAPSLGISLSPLDKETRDLTGADEGMRGVFVNSVDPDGPAATQLFAGDVITAARGRPITDPDAFVEVLEAAHERSAVLLHVWHAGNRRFVGLRLEMG
jgi:serine protease Do